MTRVENSPGFQYVERPETELPGVRKIVMLGDAGCTGFDDASRKVLGRILEEPADLFFFLGDLVFTGAEEEFREIIDFCNARVKVPVFALCGNHDLVNYPKFFGRRTYALVLGPWVCVFLCDAPGRFSDEDLGFLRESFERHSDKKFILLMHIPPPAPGYRNALRSEEWRRLRGVLDPRRSQIAHLFCGHIHGFHEYSIDGYPVTVTAGGGAAMIHALLPPAKPLYHSMAIFLGMDFSLKVELLPVPG